MENKAEQGFLERIFHLKENHIDVRTEIIAGITTFMTMAYILAVNPSVLDATGMNRGTVFAVTTLASLIATLLMTAFANYPFILAPGIELSAYFAYTIVLQMGCSWEMALTTIFIEGLIFVALSLASVRETIFNAVPMNLRHTVSTGIELFIIFIGFQSAKTVVESATLVSVFSFKGSLEAGTFNSVGITVLLALVGVLITSILVVKGVKGSILRGVLITWLLGIICGVTGLYQPNADLGMFSVLPDFFSGFGIQNMAPTFFEIDFSGILSFSFITIMFAFPFVDMFDTLGALINMASKVDMLDKDGELPEIKGALMADAVGTSLGAIPGASITITFVGSVSGIAEGGRTSFTSVVAALFFGLSLFLSPIFLAIPSFATAPALIIVGFLMVSSIPKIDFSDFTETTPSHIAIIVTSFIYSISEGITMSVISYVVINLVTGHAKKGKISLLVYVLAVLLALKYTLI